MWAPSSSLFPLDENFNSAHLNGNFTDKYL